jgi:hypothetical protein
MMQKYLSSFIKPLEKLGDLLHIKYKYYCTTKWIVLDF